MITKIADNIISPLGTTSEENFKAVLAGESMLKKQEGTFGLPEPFCASLFDRERIVPLLDVKFNREVRQEI